MLVYFECGGGWGVGVGGVLTGTRKGIIYMRKYGILYKISTIHHMTYPVQSKHYTPYGISHTE